TQAVLEALLDIKSPFQRTAKYGNAKSSKYRRRSHWLPWIDLILGSYFLLTVFYAISADNYFTVPFLLLFVVGYYYAAVLMLVQDNREALARWAQALLPGGLPTARHRDKPRRCGAPWVRQISAPVSFWTA